MAAEKHMVQKHDCLSSQLSYLTIPEYFELGGSIFTPVTLYMDTERHMAQKSTDPLNPTRRPRCKRFIHFRLKSLVSSP